MQYILVSDSSYALIDFTNGTWTYNNGHTWFNLGNETTINNLTFKLDEADSHYMPDFPTIEEWIASLHSDEDCIHINLYAPTVITDPYDVCSLHPELLV